MRKILYASSLAVIVAAAAAIVFAQGPPPTSKGWIHIPDSTIERIGDVGFRAHTNHLIHVLPQGKPIKPSTPRGMSPSKLWSYYVGSGSPNGGYNVIAIVDAYHYPTALNDFNYFSNQFGLPQEPSTTATASGNHVFQVVYATGTQPRANCGWAQEAALDIEWAHAMAPNAKIVLVEAATNSFADLFKAVDVATKIVKDIGGGQVSMSWGGNEFSTEQGYDSHFVLNQNVVYFASSGDAGGKTIYPSVSPYVVAAGGTTLLLSGTSITGEKGWSGSGGGPSQYIPFQTYQLSNGVTLPGSARGVPDISFDADPYTGVAVYDSTVCQGMVGWMVFGGTSVSSPALAGLTNAAGSKALDSVAQLSLVYASKTHFTDIVGGTAGSYTAITGWDFVTGLGTPKTLGGM